MLRLIQAADVPCRRSHAIDVHTSLEAARIVEDVRMRGEAALREHAFRLGDLARLSESIVLNQAALQAACDRLPATHFAVLSRVAFRVREFAEAQIQSFRELTHPVPGGTTGHRIHPVRRAGCYAPGGLYPLPSTVLMTAVTARAAGVTETWIASPHPSDATLAAAAVASANGLLAVGGAQAIAALAYGAGGIPSCDVIVGPGNRWVTAAKAVVSRDVRIDLHAGPSELVVVADESANPIWVAADLLAQAEHDPDALPILISLNSTLIDRVNSEIKRQLADLATSATAMRSLVNGYALAVTTIDAAADLANRIAPEHLQLCIEDPGTHAPRFRDAGAVFMGHISAEVLGDYGVGPNHVLPTGGTARSTSGLSVFNFLRMSSYIHITDGDNMQQLMEDAAILARMEGLEAHARAVELRML